MFTQPMDRARVSGRPCLPATLFGDAIVSRALTGCGPTGVAGALRGVLQRNALQSLSFSRSQHLQRLQQPVASRMCMRGRARASAGASTRGLGSVASVASVADDKSIYISMVYPQRSPQRLAIAAAQGVAARSCSIGSAAPQAIKYPRIFKGLRVARPRRAATAGNGVFGVSAAAPARPRAELGQGRAKACGLALEGVQAGHFGPILPPVASENERYQALRRPILVNAASIEGVASPSDPTPPTSAGPHPPATAPLSAARLAAPAGPSGGFPGRRGENADRWGGGARGSGAPGFFAAKTGVLEKPGSGEVRHG